MTESITTSAPKERVKSPEESIVELTEFNLVMDVSWSGEVRDVKLNDKISGVDPEKVAKASAIAAWAINGLTSAISEGQTEEIDVVTKDALVLLFPSKEGIKVSVSSSA